MRVFIGTAAALIVLWGAATYFKSTPEGEIAQQEMRVTTVSLEEFIPPKREFSDRMEAQIKELVADGFSRREAIAGLQEVYQSPNLNPEAAVRIVKMARNIETIKRSPDPWR